MNRNKIEIRIAGPQETLLLELTPQHYKQQFREFVERYRLDEQQAFQLKNAVQSVLIRLARGEEIGRESSVQCREMGVGKEVGVGNEVGVGEGGEKEKMEQSIQTEVKAEQLRYVKQSEDIETNYSTAVAAYQIRQDTEQQQEALPCFRTVPQQQTQSAVIKQNRQDTTVKQIQPKSMLTQSATIKKIYTPQPQPKHKPIQLSPPRPAYSRSPSSQAIFGRLHHTPTNSFKNKHNEDINRSEQLDYQEVKNYQLKNNLKRTTNSFFTRLSQHNTISSSRKHLPEPERQEEVFIHKTPSPKGHGKLGEPAKWESGCRCEMKEEIKKREKELSQHKAKEEEVRKRVMQYVKSKKQLSPPKSSLHISRQCEACHPKTPKKVQVPQKPKPQAPKLSRPYMSNILQDSYREFTKGLPSS